MNCMPSNAAARRYRARFTPAMCLYVCFILGSAWIFKHHHPSGVLAYTLAVLPSLPLVGTIVIVGLYLVEEQDEFQRTVLVQSMLWGIGVTLAVTTVWGFLEMLAGVPHFQPWIAYPLFWFCVGIATPILKWRYR